MFYCVTNLCRVVLRWTCWRRSPECWTLPWSVRLAHPLGGFRAISRAGALPARPLPACPTPRCRCPGLFSPVTFDDQLCTAVRLVAAATPHTRRTGESKEAAPSPKSSTCARRRVAAIGAATLWRHAPLGLSGWALHGWLVINSRHDQIYQHSHVPVSYHYHSRYEKSLGQKNFPFSFPQVILTELYLITRQYY